MVKQRQTCLTEYGLSLVPPRPRNRLVGMMLRRILTRSSAGRVEKDALSWAEEDMLAQISGIQEAQISGIQEAQIMHRRGCRRVRNWSRRYERE